MVACNVLDLTVDINSETRTVTFTCYTDAPCGTHLIASAERRYQNHAGDDCVWILFNERLVVEPSGTGDLNSVSASFAVDDADSRALSSFNDSLGPYSKGMASTLSDTISISVVLGGDSASKLLAVTIATCLVPWLCLARPEPQPWLQMRPCRSTAIHAFH